MNQNIISVALIGAIAFLGYKIYKSSTSKRVGDLCSFAEGGPDGFIVAKFDQYDPQYQYLCRRCNNNGCSSYKIEKSKISMYANG